jgi:hypothetical protein
MSQTPSLSNMATSATSIRAPRLELPGTARRCGVPMIRMTDAGSRGQPLGLAHAKVRERGEPFLDVASELPSSANRDRVVAQVAQLVAVADPAMEEIVTQLCGLNAA